MEAITQSARVEPLSPDQVYAEKVRRIPEEVIEVFNEQIADSINKGGRAVVYQDEVVEALTERGLSRSDIFDRGWLNIEKLYAEKGWKVVYDRPVYYGGENFRAHFIFTSP